MKIATADCIAYLQAYIEFPSSPQRAREFTRYGGAWKRASKFKNRPTGEWVRVFYKEDEPDEFLYVVEDSRGNLRVETERPGEVWLFAFHEDQEECGVEEGYVGYMIVAKSYYDKEGCFDSTHLLNRLEGLLPEGTDESMEATFESPGTVEQVRAFLLSKGMVEIQP